MQAKNRIAFAAAVAAAAMLAVPAAAQAQGTRGIGFNTTPKPQPVFRGNIIWSSATVVQTGSNLVLTNPTPPATAGLGFGQPKPGSGASVIVPFVIERVGGGLTGLGFGGGGGLSRLQGNILTLSGRSATENIFNLNAAQLGGAQRVVLQIPTGSTAVLNINGSVIRLGSPTGGGSTGGSTGGGGVIPPIGPPAGNGGATIAPFGGPSVDVPIPLQSLRPLGSSASEIYSPITPRVSQAVPEPGLMLAFGAGAAAFLARRRRKKTA